MFLTTENAFAITKGKKVFFSFSCILKYKKGMDNILAEVIHNAYPQYAIPTRLVITKHLNT